MTIRMIKFILGCRRGDFRALEHEMNYSRVGGVIYNATAPGENRAHSAVVAANVGFELGDSVVMRDACQMPDQPRADAGALVFIERGQGDFRPRRRLRPDVAGDADKVFAAAAVQGCRYSHMSIEV
jgi:hypothetical protein